MAIQLVCEKCEAEINDGDDMSHPETGCGNYCFECYIELEHDWNVKRGIAFLECELPSLDDFMRGYKKFAFGSLNPRSMENNCHAASSALVKILGKKCNIKLQRGHWIGMDIRNKTRSMQQHSWTKVRIPGNDVEFIVDPTQWVFTGDNPSLCIVDADDCRYDIGGYGIKAALYKHDFPERTGTLRKTNLSDSPKKWLSSQFNRDWSVWSIDEILALANMDPRSMAGNEKEIFDAIVKSGNEAFIPVDGLALAMGKM